MSNPWLTVIIAATAGAAAIAVVPDRLLFVAPDHAGATHDGSRWACPMICFVGQNPGTCPFCGMAMTRMTAGEISREQVKRIGVQLVKVATGSAHVTIRAAGSADYDHRSTRLITARVAGRIVKRHPATFGCCQDVAAGESIVDLFSPEVFQAQVELRAALAAGDRAAITAITARFARWNLGPVADAITAGGEPSDTIAITAPVDGQVWLQDQKMVDEALLVGKEISADTPLLRVIDPAALVLTVHVPERHAWMLREGTHVEVSSDDRGWLRGLNATINRVAREIDPAIRTVEVRIYLRGVSKKLRPGSLVQVRLLPQLRADEGALETGDEPGRFLLIPKDAVLSTGIRHVAWRLDGTLPNGSQRFVIATLDLGARIEDDAGNDCYIVRAGLSAGDTVAARGAFLIDSQAQLAGSASLLQPAGLGLNPAAPAYAH